MLTRAATNGRMWRVLQQAVLEGSGGSIIEQGFNQTFGGSPCPPAINVKQAIAACLAGAFVGAFNPASGFRQFVTVVFAGVYGGAITGGLSPFF